MGSDAKKRALVAGVFKSTICKQLGMDAEDYSEDLVPGKKPHNGFGADLGAWFLILERIERELRLLGFKNLDITYKDAYDTQGRKLSVAVDTVTAKA